MSGIESLFISSLGLLSFYRHKAYVSLRYIIWWLDTCIYHEKIITIRLVISVPSHNYTFIGSDIIFCGKFKIYSLNNSQVYDKYSIVNYSHIRSHCIHLMAWSLY